MSFAKSIVVGTDGSDTASLAVERAALLAASADARLVVVTAFAHDHDDAVLAREQAPDEVTWQVGDRAAADDIANRARSRARELGARNVVVQAVEGAPAATLLGTAEQFGADLIVVGSVGLSSPKRFVLGSVAGTVAHHAPCDVLIVHTD